jgi:signal transduction histidine kinase
MRTVPAHPVAVLVAFRWVAWLIALVDVLAGGGTATSPISQEALLAVTALALAAETALARRPAFRPSLAPTARRAARRSSDRARIPRFRPPLPPTARRAVLAVAAADTVLSLAAVYLSGGWGSPFYHYALTSLLVPAFVLPLGPALAWAGVYILAYLGAAVAASGAEDDVLRLLSRNFASLATPLLVVLIERYLARLSEAFARAETQAARERARAERALTETEALFRIAEAVAANLADEAALLTSIVTTTHRTGLFGGLTVCLVGPDGAVTVERAFGPHRRGAEALTLPLHVRGEHLGTLTATPADGPAATGSDTVASATPAFPAFVEALAQQVALGVYDARLFAQREELATQAERGRIAREIHDGMAQSLYMLSLGLEACADAADGSQDPAELGRRLGALVGVSKQALWEARRYIFDLTPSSTGEHALVAMVENLTKEFETVSRVPATLTVAGEPRAIPPPLAAALYRISQEALANVFKHAAAQHAAVMLAFLPEAVRLTVTDDGRGLPEAGRRGYGLGNMRRRAEDVGGVCTIASTPGHGTSVRVEAPTGHRGA